MYYEDQWISHVSQGNVGKETCYHFFSQTLMVALGKMNCTYYGEFDAYDNRL